MDGTTGAGVAAATRGASRSSGRVGITGTAGGGGGGAGGDPTGDAGPGVAAAVSLMVSLIGTPDSHLRTSREFASVVRSAVTESVMSRSLQRGGGIVNVVMLVGEVTDRPFRPGNGARTVIKIQTRGGSSGRPDRFEFDAFGQPGEFGIRLFVGDMIAVTGRLEDRAFKEGGETVNELRIVADFIELVTRAGDRANRPAPHHGTPADPLTDDDNDDD
jgi:hypothetical protein